EADSEIAERRRRPVAAAGSARVVRVRIVRPVPSREGKAAATLRNSAIAATRAARASTDPAAAAAVVARAGAGPVAGAGAVVAVAAAEEVVDDPQNLVARAGDGCRARLASGLADERSGACTCQARSTRCG